MKKAFYVMTIVLFSVAGAAYAELSYTISDLGTIEGFTEWTVPLAINDSSTVVGYVDNGAGGSQGFSWSNGVMNDLGTLGGQDSVGRDVNNLGQIVGLAKDANESMHSVIWNDSGICERRSKSIPPGGRLEIVPL